MAYDLALSTVQMFHAQMAQFARAVVAALADRRLEATEAFGLSMRGMLLAQTMIAVLKQGDPQLHADIVYVLEHGAWTLPEGEKG